MRPIEFRGKDIISGKWVEGDLIHGVRHKHGNVYILPLVPNLASIPNADPLDGVKVDPATVGMFTGIHDKNGNKIWEGDLVMTSQGVKDVFYDNTVGGFCFTMKVQGRALGDRSTGVSGDPEMSFPIFNAVDKEIIGNIHENQQP